MNTSERAIPSLHFVMIALALLFVPFAVAQDGAAEGEADAQEEERAGVRFANLVPEGPSVEILVDGEARVEELAPGTVSRYIFVSPGEHTIEVVSRDVAAEPDADASVGDPAAATDEPGAPAGDPAAPPADGAMADPAAPGMADDAGATEDPGPVQAEPLLNQSIELEAEAYGTFLLFRTSDGGEEGAEGETQRTEPDLEGRLMPDGVTELPGAGRAMVRVVHGAPDVGPVTVVTAHRPQGGAQQDAAAEADSDAGQGDAAQDEPAEEGAPDDEQDQEDGEASQDAQAQERQGPAPIDGEPIVSELAPRESGEYASVPAGSHHLQVHVRDGIVAVDLDEVLFESGLVYTLYIAATDGGETVVVTPTVDGGISADER